MLAGEAACGGASWRIAWGATMFLRATGFAGGGRVGAGRVTGGVFSPSTFSPGSSAGASTRLMTARITVPGASRRKGRRCGAPARSKACSSREKPRAKNRERERGSGCLVIVGKFRRIRALIPGRHHPGFAGVVAGIPQRTPSGGVEAQPGPFCFYKALPVPG